MAPLGADDRARLEEATALCKVPMASLTKFRPWLAGATLEDAFYQAIKKMLLEKAPAMAVLGHFHLVGSDGLLAQLEAAGMTVRRI